MSHRRTDLVPALVELIGSEYKRVVADAGTSGIHVDEAVAKVTVNLAHVLGVDAGALVRTVIDALDEQAIAGTDAMLNALNDLGPGATLCDVVDLAALHRDDEPSS